MVEAPAGRGRGDRRRRPARQRVAAGAAQPSRPRQGDRRQADMLAAGMVQRPLGRAHGRAQLADAGRPELVRQQIVFDPCQPLPLGAPQPARLLYRDLRRDCPGRGQEPAKFGREPAGILYGEDRALWERRRAKSRRRTSPPRGRAGRSRARGQADRSPQAL
jgi:hypothetical protein